MIGPLNRSTYHPRLGLARALAKTSDGIEESKKYYEEVITMAPEVLSHMVCSHRLQLSTHFLNEVMIFRVAVS